MGFESSVDPEKENVPTPITPLRRALPQIIAIGIQDTLLFAFGMTYGFPTILIPSLSEKKNGETLIFNQESISWIGSVGFLCVPLGCLFSGIITQRLGQKKSLQLANIPVLVAFLLFYYASEYWHVFLALCITGFNGGLTTAPSLTYLAEVTTPNLRGVLASASGVAVLLGISMEFFLGTFFPWRTVALISCIFPVISYFLLFFIPESPYWLASKNRLEEAQKSIAWLRGWLDRAEVEEEFRDFCKSFKSKSQSETADTKTPDTKRPTNLSLLRINLHLYLQKRFLWPFSLVILCFALEHFGGMTTLQTYCVVIFGNLKVPIDNHLATVILGFSQALGCILSSVLVHFVGKRKINLFSLVGRTFCFCVVATYAHVRGLIDLRIIGQGDQDGIAADSFSWIPMTFLIGASLFSNIGISILPWILVGEVYHTEIRSTASGLSGAVTNILGFCVNKTFLSLVSLITLPGTLWMYSGISAVGFILLYFLLPETEGKTLFQITEHFGGGRKLDNTVAKSDILKKIKKKSTLANTKLNPAFDDAGCDDKNSEFNDTKM